MMRASYLAIIEPIGTQTSIQNADFNSEISNFEFPIA